MSLNAKWARAFVFLIYGNHHEEPNDPLRGLMPLIVSVPIACGVWWACMSLWGQVGYWLFMGWITGYVAYDLMHYSCHHGRWKGRWFLAFKRHHMRHHYRDQGCNFGVSTGIWDRVFRTRKTDSKCADTIDVKPD